MNSKAKAFTGAMVAAVLAEIARREIDSRLLYARACAWNTGFVAGQDYVEQNVGASVDYKFAEPDNPHSVAT